MANFYTKPPAPPEWLSEEEKQHFKWICSKLARRKCISAADIPILAAASQFYIRFLHAEKHADKKAAINEYQKLLAPIREILVSEKKKIEKQNVKEEEEKDDGEDLAKYFS